MALSKSTPPSFTTIGPTIIRTSYTSINDIGLALTRLSILALSDPGHVPAHVRIQGSTRSYEEIARALEKTERLGDGEVRIVTLDLMEQKRNLKEECILGRVKTPIQHIRCILICIYAPQEFEWIHQYPYGRRLVRLLCGKPERAR